MVTAAFAVPVKGEIVVITRMKQRRHAAVKRCDPEMKNGRRRGEDGVLNGADISVSLSARMARTGAEVKNVVITGVMSLRTMTTIPC